MASRIIILFVLLLHLVTITVSGQTQKEKDYKVIDSFVTAGFVLKKAEAGLKGQALRNQIVRRSKQFRQAAIRLNEWIYKYYPNKEQNLSTGYVKAEFMLGLYMEYACGLRAALGQYRYVESLLYDLYTKNMAEPTYNGASIGGWVNEKIPVIYAAVNTANSSNFEFNILLSKESDLQKVIDVLAAKSDDSSFKETISGNRDEIFALRTAARALADSIGGEELSAWSAVCFDNIFRGIKLPYTKDSIASYQCWLAGTDAKAGKFINEQLLRIDSSFHVLLAPGKTLKPLSLVMNLTSDSVITAKDFHYLFSNANVTDPDLELLDRERWRYRCILLSRNTDSLVREALVSVALAWTLNDFDTVPPDWVIGVPLLFAYNSEAGPMETYHLYALQTAVEQGKLPAIESFISNSREDTEYGPYNFSSAYARYFCYFLYTKGVLKELYRMLHTDRSLRATDGLMRYLEGYLKMSIEDINGEFRKFVGQRDLQQDIVEGWERKKEAEEYTKKFLRGRN